jgi:adenosylcobinamide kinase / adenosylcobinamide-phosphate guanylyltransferase
MGQLTLILGGARSGKSTFAQQLAEASDRVLFVATAEAHDEEMRDRIEKHRQARPTTWRTLEISRGVGQAILDAGQVDLVLVDCLTLLVANLVMGVEDPFDPSVEKRVQDEIQGLLACAARLNGHLIVVSNEVGLGLVPPYPLGRAYRDLLGQANQILAQQADVVYLLVAGLPLVLKNRRQA